MYRVLLVEDDSAMRYLYQKMKVWSECGFEIAAEASNGKKALDLLEETAFDLIFTDIRMPLIDGIELLRHLREQGNDTIVIFASSYSEFEYARQGMVLGAFDYVLKPVEQSVLKEVLNRVTIRLQTQGQHEAISPVVTEALAYCGLSADADHFIHKVAVYYSEHYQEAVSLEIIAEAFAFNKDYFGKLFKQHMGIHFHDFSTMIKICYAKELFRIGNYKAYEVSELLGYSSVDYFTRKFKEVTGTTPSKFRSEG